MQLTLYIIWGKKQARAKACGEQEQTSFGLWDISVPENCLMFCKEENLFKFWTYILTALMHYINTWWQIWKRYICKYIYIYMWSYFNAAKLPFPFWSKQDFKRSLPCGLYIYMYMYMIVRFESWLFWVL